VLNKKQIDFPANCVKTLSCESRALVFVDSDKNPRIVDSILTQGGGVKWTLGVPYPCEPHLLIGGVRWTPSVPYFSKSCSHSTRRSAV